MSFLKKKWSSLCDRRTSPVSGGMDDDAWDDIVVRAQRPKQSAACTAVHRAIDELRDSIDSHVLPAGSVIDQLIDIWSLARQVDPAAAKPVEAILSAVAGRDAISADEVYAACDQIESALAGAGRAHAGL